ncbi:MAG: Hpt domain-containing protein [Moraxellaceae bacterium]|nr:Hpt domain-containing protein [Moraxellaceae bacterium]MBP7229083.1 Hpt domain-containing protein [Moraxellaceae bacterium]MBP8852782.1 Hpt domain-containing protein [Moraxellaceae bacterium]MBP9045009.1 Hpt domain-containing protein [Moraxellaceae bacterium]MBP9730040.1 Hpt domain-containing protein [Moraxellaceae bacterium]
MRYLDEDLLEELREILDDEFPVLVSTYIQDSTVRVKGLHDAYARGDNEALRLTVHSLKGASANLGLECLTDVCRELEEAVMGESPERMDGLLARISDEQQRATKLLTNFL